MSTRHENADGPEDIDAAFAEIVAGLEREEPMARWPEEATRTGSEAPQKPAEPEAAEAAPRDWTPPADTPDEGHYEPPEPPPMPRPTVTTIGGIALVVVGMILLLVPGLVGLGATAALPIGLVAVSSGIGWLLFRMRRTPPDDGAQL